MVEKIFAADPIFEANPRQVTELIYAMDGRKLALPDFQRDFTWEPRRTAELLRSVMCRYPAGSLLLWRAGSDTEEFASRPVEGAEPFNGVKPTELVLDGQQRLTSLYQALLDKGDETYFVRLEQLIDGSHLRDAPDVDWDLAVYWTPKNSKAAEEAMDPTWQFDHATLPINAIWEFDEWLDRCSSRRAAGDLKKEKDLKRLFRMVRDRYLMPLRTYAFPVVTLPENTPLEAVVTVFETLNRTGKPLGPFELLTARFYPKGINLRDLWSEAGQSYPILGDFDVDPYNVLQAVSLRANGSSQRSDVLRKLEAKHVEEHWQKVVSGFAGVLDMLGSECGVLTKKLLPYSMLLVPMSAVWPDVQAHKPAERAGAIERVQRYFWCSVFQATFDQGANSQAGADYSKLRYWLFDAEQPEPRAVAEFGVLKSTLRNATVRRRAIYTGLLAMTVRAGARDFHHGQTLTKQMMIDQRIDSHHIFPKGFLKDLPGKVNSELALNRALIDSETNKIIGSQAPSEYIPEMRKIHTADKLSQVLASHLVDESDESGLMADDYERFIDERLAAAVIEIERLTGGKVADDPEV